MASSVPSLNPLTRLAPVVQLAGKIRRHLGTDGLSVWLLKMAVRHARGRKTRTHSPHEPDAWRAAWERGGVAGWPTEPVTGIIEWGDIRLAMDRSEITAAGHLWLDGWALGPASQSFELAADRCSVAWQSTVATARPDVAQALQLSPDTRDANAGFQLLARIADYAPGRSRLALTVRDGGGQIKLVIPVAPHIERSGSLWHSVYDTMRQRGPRDVAYLETSVRLLKEVRKADWRERSAAICRSIDEAMSEVAGLKVLVLSRHHPNVAYLNLNLLAGASSQPAEFVVCSMGQQAIQRASEYSAAHAAIGVHAARFVSAEIGTPSSEIIEQFALSCRRRRCPCLIVHDDVAVTGAMGSLASALGDTTLRPTAWPRLFPRSGPAQPVFAVPLGMEDGPGPYWRSAHGLEQTALGALLFDPTDMDIPPIPPFEGRGFGLEYLRGTALTEALLSSDTMIDMVEPSGQREAQGLDMLMLLAG